MQSVLIEICVEILFIQPRNSSYAYQISNLCAPYKQAFSQGNVREEEGWMDVIRKSETTPSDSQGLALSNIVPFSKILETIQSYANFFHSLEDFGHVCDGTGKG